MAMAGPGAGSGRGSSGPGVTPAGSPQGPNPGGPTVGQMLSHPDVGQVAGRVLAAFRPKFKLLQGAHSVGTSIGISIFPRDGTDATELLQNADIAMYSVKTSGKGGYRFYDLKFFDELRARLVGLIQAPATKIARVISAPGAQLARVVQAYADKSEAA